MYPRTHHFSTPSTRKPQHGVALIVVIIVVMLSMLLALWASRTSFFNELLTSNDADYQRAFEAAQALIQDAEFDIRGETSNGNICKEIDKCRAYMDVIQFPADSKEINPLIIQLDKESTHCKDALCTRRIGRQDFWNNNENHTPSPADREGYGETKFKELQNVGARYGQYTNAKKDGLINPILTETEENTGGWYWIEVMRYSDSPQNENLIIGSASHLPLNLDVYVIYRITALAYGRKAGTVAVLQQTYARQRLKN